MNTQIRRHKFHGDPARFEIVADYVADTFIGKVKTIADVTGGQGMLSRILNKQYNFESEIIDPRGWALKGVPNRPEEYTASMADYYDLIVGLHPDEALRDVVESALIRPVIVIPCCNFWTREKKMGRDELLKEIEKYCQEHGIIYEQVVFDFKGPKNIGLISRP